MRLSSLGNPPRPTSVLEVSSMEEGVPDPSMIQLPSPLWCPFLATLGEGIDGIGPYGCPSVTRGNGRRTAGLYLTSMSISSDTADLGEPVDARMEGALLLVMSVPACDDPLVSADAAALEVVRVKGESVFDILPSYRTMGLVLLLVNDTVRLMTCMCASNIK